MNSGRGDIMKIKHIILILLIFSIVGCATVHLDEEMDEHMEDMPEEMGEHMDNEMIKEMDEHMGDEVGEHMDEMMGSETKIFEVAAKQWEFIPSTINVKEGDNVKLIVTSTDVGHGVSIPAFGVQKNFGAGETVEIEFVADKKGTFPFTCSVYCGSGHSGMTGEIVVE